MYFATSKCLKESKKIPKGATRSRKSKNVRQYNSQRLKRLKRQPMIYKTLHRKLQIDQHEPHCKPL